MNGTRDPIIVLLVISEGDVSTFELKLVSFLRYMSWVFAGMTLNFETTVLLLLPAKRGKKC